MSNVIIYYPSDEDDKEYWGSGYAPDEDYKDHEEIYNRQNEEL